MRIKFGFTRIVFVFEGTTYKIPRPSTWRQFVLGLHANLEQSRYKPHPRLVSISTWHGFIAWQRTVPVLEPTPENEALVKRLVVEGYFKETQAHGDECAENTARLENGEYALIDWWG
jgi:hypothetical protein